MRLPPSYFRPFDKVYRAVTADICSRAATLAGDERTWLERLVVTFLEERQRWNDSGQLAGYRAIWLRLNTPLLRLAAGAYLHVAYDLPRAMANDWPGQGRWAHAPTVARGEGVFMGLASIFPLHFQLSLGLGWLPPGLFRDYLDAPMDRLRRGAWAHARILATEPGRPQREAAMAEALTMGLKDAWDLQPWKIKKFLRPPDGAVFPVVTVPLLTLVAGSSLATGLTVAVVLWGLFEWRLYVARNRQMQREFIATWGEMLEDYVRVAVREPEDLERFRHQRRIDLRLDTAD
jgi:hypothetical protein